MLKEIFFFKQIEQNEGILIHIRYYTAPPFRLRFAVEFPFIKMPDPS